MRKSRQLNSKRKTKIKSKKGGYRRQRYQGRKRTLKRLKRTTRRMRGGNLVSRVGEPWNPSNIDTWGLTNYYSLKDYFARMNIQPSR
tara:strand:+ start:72 stop:332 length:261 start_codon:yes stop_codon:yes gene_type:complete